VGLLGGPVLRFGSVPNVSFGGRLSAELGIGHVAAGIEGTWTVATTEDNSVVSAQTWALSGAAYGCPFSVQNTHFRLGGCLYIEAGGVVAEGTRISIPRTETAWLLDVGARLRAGVHWSFWTIGLEVGGGPFIVRPNVVYDVSGTTGTLAQAWPALLDVFVSAGLWLR
jgi:hypothetical protein